MNVQLEEPQAHFYTGEKNSQIFKKMLAFHSKSNVLPLKFVCKTVISKHKIETKAMLNQIKDQFTLQPMINKNPFAARQEITILTCDWQLYKIVVKTVWADPESWSQFFQHLGRKDMLMSFIGSMGKLMSGSRLSMLIGKAFAGVEKMPTFPVNLCTL